MTSLPMPSPGMTAMRLGEDTVGKVTQCDVSRARAGIHGVVLFTLLRSDALRKIPHSPAGVRVRDDSHGRCTWI
jgi:hypothetical protein